MSPDWSPGDVIWADKEGNIILDDGIETWNPIRASIWLQKKFLEQYGGGNVTELTKEIERLLLSDEFVSKLAKALMSSEIEPLGLAVRIDPDAIISVDVVEDTLDNKTE